MATPLSLMIIIASTRPGRVGSAVADWFHGAAQRHAQSKPESSFNPSLVDLAEVNLPIFDEPNHPRQQKYVHEHTKRWSAMVAAADAFVLVTPEYNFGPTPALLNALTYLYNEWSYKPAGFVSYGGASGGLRAVQMTKLTLTTLKIVPIVEAVSIPLVHQQISEEGAAGEAGAKLFKASDGQEKSAAAMLDELHRWAAALATMR
jgi:NAD(P)H-dependent FMN reductase